MENLQQVCRSCILLYQRFFLWKMYFSWKKWLNEHFFETLSETFLGNWRVFSAVVSNFHSAQRGGFFHWTMFFLQIGSADGGSSFGGKNLTGLWLMSTTTFFVQWRIRAKNLYLRTLFFWNFCPIPVEHYRPVNLVQVCRRHNLPGQWNFPWWNFFWKTFNFATFFGLREKYLQSFGRNFLQGCKSRILVFEKILRIKHTFWKKDTLYECFETLKEKKLKFWRVFPAGLSEKSTFPEVFLGERSFFWKKILFFVMTFGF